MKKKGFSTTYVHDPDAELRGEAVEQRDEHNHYLRSRASVISLELTLREGARGQGRMDATDLRARCRA